MAKMKKKIIVAAVAVLSIVASAAVASQTSPWLGWVAKSGDGPYSSTWKRVEVVKDSNGCQYLVATGGSDYTSGSYGISITPRINSATHQPHCS